MPPGERRPIFCDLVDKTHNVLIEAKGSVTRDAIRMAIGQLTDYRRFAGEGVRLAVLLPERPREDLQHLLAAAGVRPIFPSTGGYEDSGLALTA